MTRIRDTYEGSTGVLVTAPNFNTLGLAIDDIANLFTMQGQMVFALGLRNWMALNPPPPSLAHPRLSFNQTTMAPEWVEGVEVSGTAGLRHLCTAGPFPTAAVSGNFGNQYLFRADADAPDWLFIGGGQPDFGIKDDKDPGDNFLGFRVKAGVGADFATRDFEDAGIDIARGVPLDTTLPGSNTANVAINGSYEDQRDNPQYRIQGRNKTLPADFYIDVWAIERIGPPGRPGPGVPAGGTVGQWLQKGDPDNAWANLPVASGSQAGLIAPAEYARIHASIDISHLEAIPEMAASTIEDRDDILLFDRSVAPGQPQLRELSFREAKKIFLPYTVGRWSSSQTLMRIGRPRAAAPSLTVAKNNIDWGQTAIQDVTPRLVDTQNQTHIPVRILKTEKPYLNLYRVAAGDAGEEVYILGGSWVHIGDDDADNDWAYYDAIVPSPGLPAEGDVLVEKYARPRTTELVIDGDPPNGDFNLGTRNGVFDYYRAYEPVIISSRQGNLNSLLYDGNVATSGRVSFQRNIDATDYAHGLFKLVVEWAVTDPHTQNIGFSQVSGRSTAGKHKLVSKYEGLVDDFIDATKFSASEQLLTGGIVCLDDDVYDGSANISDGEFRVGLFGDDNEFEMEYRVTHESGDGTATFRLQPRVVTAWIEPAP